MSLPSLCSADISFPIQKSITKNSPRLSTETASRLLWLLLSSHGWQVFLTIQEIINNSAQYLSWHIDFFCSGELNTIKALIRVIWTATVLIMGLENMVIDVMINLGFKNKFQGPKNYHVIQPIIFSQNWNEWCFRPRFCTARLYWAGDNLGYRWRINEKMDGDLSLDSVLQGYTGPGTMWAIGRE